MIKLDSVSPQEEQDLKPCPFCGSTKLKIECKRTLVGHTGLSDRVENHTFSVRCKVCHARGGAAGGKVFTPHIKFKEYTPPEWSTTDEALSDRAVEAWNRRSDNG